MHSLIGFACFPPNRIGTPFGVAEHQVVPQVKIVQSCWAKSHLEVKESPTEIHRHSVANSMKEQSAMSKQFMPLAQGLNENRLLFVSPRAPRTDLDTIDLMKLISENIYY